MVNTMPEMTTPYTPDLNDTVEQPLYFDQRHGDATDTQPHFFYLMSNKVQDYAWGSRTALTLLFTIENPNAEPQAELWMGAHPNGCSEVFAQGRSIKLSELIKQDPIHYLGDQATRNFGELPYLFKVLAAEQALSIQVHPSKAQAEAGFAKELQLGIPLTAANRNYKDPNHKPELVYALTDYHAMNGFREIEQIIAHFKQLNIDVLNPLVSDLIEQPNSDGLKHFFSAILSLQGESKEIALTMLMVKARQSNEPLFELILQLAEQYPGDIGLFAPLMLNVITLKPGQAMFLDACTPHAYIQGTGLEIMANSDNVLRAGLTPKYIDVEELVACTLFAPKPIHQLVLKPLQQQNIEYFPVEVADFKFAVIHHPDSQVVSTSSAEILLPLDKPLTLTHANGEVCQVAIGESVFIPAFTGQYQLSSQGRVARAYC